MSASMEHTVDITIARRERAKRYLEQYCALLCRSIQSKLLLEQLEKQREDWTQNYESCGGGSGSRKDLGDIVANFEKLVEDAKARTEALAFFYTEIEHVVASVQVVSPSAATAIAKKYLLIGKSPDWKDIADELRYAEATVKMHHARGLDLVADILEERNYDVKLYTFLYAKP